MWRQPQPTATAQLSSARIIRTTNTIKSNLERKKKKQMFSLQIFRVFYYLFTTSLR